MVIALHNSLLLFLSKLTEDANDSSGFSQSNSLFPFDILSWVFLFNFILILIIGTVIFYFLFNSYKKKFLIKLNEERAQNLKKLDLIKSGFISNISNELKTPLKLIKGPVERMLSSKDNTIDPREIQMMHRSTTQLQKYIEEVLELSKLDANKLKLQVRKTDIVKYSRSVLDELQAISKKQHIKLNFESSHHSLITYIDPEKYNKILTSISLNAIKHARKYTDVIITLSGCSGNMHKYCTQKEGCIIVSVKNFGKGIASEKIPFVFEKCYKFDNNHINNTYFNGLELSLAKELILLHKGTIEVDSIENDYTNFMIRLPFGHYHYKADELFDTCIGGELKDNYTVNIKIESDDESEMDSKIILIIEDHSDMRTIIRTALNREFKIVEAVDGDEGISIAKKTSPDIILCDINLPGKNGYEVCKMLKSDELTSHIPIIFLSGRDSLNDKLTGLEIGADDYLIKPFYMNELKARVNNILDQRELLKQKFKHSNLLNLSKIESKSIDQSFLENVVNIIESHMADEDFGVQVLMKKLCMSRTPLHRKLKALVNKSANELIQNIRLQKASELLKNNAGTIAEIGYLVGYPSPPYFTRAFKQHFGHTPSEHINS